MSLREFARAGHLPTLIAAFLYFDVSFMVWVLIGALGIYISAELGLSATEKGFLVAAPILAGSVLRIVLGVAVDRFGAKRVGALGLCGTLVPLFWAWQGATTYGELLAVAFLLGLAGASFAVALPLASRWYPPERQGLAMGVAAAGNSGTVIAAFFAPRLAEVFGWRGVFALAAGPVTAVLLFFALLARDSARQPAPRRLGQYLSLVGEPDAWWFSVLYMVSFGGFVGLASFLPIFFFDQYGTSRVMAGNLTALSVFAGSFARPIGGYLADRLGGIRLLGILYGMIGLLLIAVAALPPLPLLVALIFAAMAGLGIGNGAVFQLVPQRFGREIGVATGVIGAAGGLGGFLLPALLGALKDASGSYATGLALFACVAVAAAALLRAVEQGWRREWAREDLEVAF